MFILVFVLLYCPFWLTVGYKFLLLSCGSPIVCNFGYIPNSNESIIFFITWLCWIVGHEAHFKSVDAIVKGKNYFEKLF